jgi:hypothetical protein
MPGGGSLTAEFSYALPVNHRSYFFLRAAQSDGGRALIQAPDL